MPFTFNGIGTTYYGNRDIGPEGSFVTTEWLVFIYLPILPLRSFRVLPTGQNTSAFVYNSHGYLARRVPLCWAQIRNIYLGLGIFVAAVFALIFGISYVASRNSQPTSEVVSRPVPPSPAHVARTSNSDLNGLSADDLFFLLGVDTSLPRSDEDKALKLSESRRRFKLVELPPQTVRQEGTVFESLGRTWRIERILSDKSVAVAEVRTSGRPN